MNIQQLKEHAASLPLEPGVYIMKDKSQKVIYVGKAKKLRNRVTQYFQENTSHSPKTKLMVSKVDHFDVIVAATEFEALILECSLIKRHMPKYNILLKDDKGFPYVRLDLKKEYPTISLASKISNDGAEYFGPYGSRSATNDLIDSIRIALKLPSCNKRFPQDIGKRRPCLNYHINQCSGWCQDIKLQEEYHYRYNCVQQLLHGNFKQVTSELKMQMELAAEDLNFELAATLRDQLKALEQLEKKQLVTSAGKSDVDVIGFAQTEAKSCFTVLHFNNGNLLDKDVELLSVVDDPTEMVSSLIKQYYIYKGYAPRKIFLPFKIDDNALIASYLEKEYSKKIYISVPQRGDNAKLTDLANKNAMDEAIRATTKEEKTSGCLHLLGKMLAIEPPKRIESFDISNISGTDIVASMVVYVDGKPKKSDYRCFKINDIIKQDDYASMRQVIYRRFSNLLNDKSGFDDQPNLVLIDGGVEHATVAADMLLELGLSTPVFGMVKDDRHRTRALVTPLGEVINIDSNQSIFSFIGSIQEETHRFAIKHHRTLRSKRLRYSQLDNIEGIGPSRKEVLLKRFKSISMISNASLMELEQCLPKNAAFAVYSHFHKENER